MRLKAIFPSKWKDGKYESENMIMIQEWSDALSCYDATVIKKAIDYCKSNYEWAPDLHGFVLACDRSLGIPEARVSLKNAISRRFDHPVTRMAFVQIGEWDFSHLSEKDLIKKFEESYKIAVSEYNSDREYYDNWNLEEKNKSILKKEPINKIQSVSSSVAKFYISMMKKKLGRKLSEEEELEIKNSLDKFKNNNEYLSNIDFYDKIRKEREEEGMRIYNKYRSQNLNNSKKSNSDSYKSWMNNYENK